MFHLTTDTCVTCTTVEITRDDPALQAWLLDAEMVDIAVPHPEAAALVCDSVELDGIDVLRARLRTPHQEN